MRQPRPAPLVIPVPALIMLIGVVSLCAFGGGLGLAAARAGLSRTPLPTRVPSAVAAAAATRPASATAALPSQTVRPTARPAATASTSPTETLPPPTPAPSPTTTPDSRVEALLAQMSLEDKLGQMLMPGIAKTFVDEGAAQVISTYHVGGIWITSRNILNSNQAGELTAALAAVQAQTMPAVPLFISIDHEGGMVNRFPYGGGVTAFPSAMALGATGDPALAYLMALYQAQELRALGFNMNLAPVLDVNQDKLNPVIGIRSFGADPAQVAAFGEQYSLGLQAGGVIGVAKHFPGHGNVAVDSHFDLPVVPGDLAALEATDLLPFQRVLRVGLPGVMAGHLMLPALDPDLPASLSPAILDGYLRQRLGFGGVILTDDITMGALARYRGRGEAVVLAVLAGADLLPIDTTDPLAETAGARDALWTAVQTGRLTVERIDASVRRILQLKLAYGLLAPAAPAPAPDLTADAGLALRIGEESVTQLRDDAGVLPLAAGLRLLVITPEDGLRVYYRDGLAKTALGLQLAAAGFSVREILYKPKSNDPQAETRSVILQAAAQYDAVIFGTWDASIDQMPSSGWQRSMAAELLSRNSRVIDVALRTPYDLRVLPGLVTGLATYGGVPAQMQALAEVLTGQRQASGQLPVPRAAVFGP